MRLEAEDERLRQERIKWMWVPVDLSLAVVDVDSQRHIDEFFEEVRVKYG